MKEEALKNLLYYMKGLIANSTISGKRNLGDFVADRITQASTKGTLLGCMERFADLMGSGASVYPDTTKRFIATATGPFAPALLITLRKYPKVIAQMLFVSAKHEDAEESAFEAMLSSESLDDLVPDVSAVEDRVTSIPLYEISITATCLNPLAHGSDTKSGNATTFRRMEAIGASGTIMSLPFYAGNAVRGQLRDLLALHFVEAIGEPRLSLWFFHTLFSGGILEENSAAQKALIKRLGDNGSMRVEGMREFRDTIPGLSLLGTAVGNRIISGRIMVNDLRPRCREWGTGDLPAAELFDWHFLTRRDDNAENRVEGEEHHGMIAMTETLKPGTVLDGGIDISSHASELEASALAHALTLLTEGQYLGAESRRGFGKVAFDIQTTRPNPINGVPYLDFLKTRKADILEYLTAIGAIECTPSN